MAGREAIGCGVMVGRPAEVDTIHLRQAVEKLGFKLASLIGGDCLWATKTGYPSTEQGT